MCKARQFWTLEAERRFHGVTTLGGGERNGGYGPAQFTKWQYR